MRKVQRIIVKCAFKNCNKEFEIRITELDKRRYCCFDCARKGTWKGENGPKYIINPNPLKKGSEELRKKLSESHKGQKPSAKARKKLGDYWRGRKRSPEQIEKLSGPNHWNWKGGPKNESAIIRQSNLYKSWRQAIFEKDNYTCRHCGQKGGWLCAHHIKSFNIFPELRFSILNGLTLCKKCHKKTDNYLSLALTQQRLPSILSLDYENYKNKDWQKLAAFNSTIVITKLDNALEMTEAMALLKPGEML